MITCSIQCDSLCCWDVNRGLPTGFMLVKTFNICSHLIYCKIKTFACTFNQPILWKQLICQISGHVNIFSSYYRPSRKLYNHAYAAEPVYFSKKQNFLMNISGFIMLILKAFSGMLYVSLDFRTSYTNAKWHTKTVNLYKKKQIYLVEISLKMNNWDFFKQKNKKTKNFEQNY